MNNLFNKMENTKNLALAMGVYTASATIVPLLIIGGAGYLLDRNFNTKPVGIIIGVLISFIFTNILLYKKAMFLSSYMSSKYGQEKEADKNKESNKD